MRVAVFGGSFNPPHRGHLRVVEALLGEAKADAVWIVPTWRHPFGKPLAAFDDRLDLCRAAFAHLGDRIQVLDIERELGGVSYTVRTMEALAAAHPGVAFVLAVGSDAVAEREHWHEFARLEQLADIVVVPRAGHPAADPRGLAISPIEDVSSTEVRERLKEGRDIDDLVGPEVARLIHARGLYLAEVPHG